MLKFIEKNGFGVMIAFVVLLGVGYSAFADYQNNETTREVIKVCAEQHMTTCSTK